MAVATSGGRAYTEAACTMEVLEQVVRAAKGYTRGEGFHTEGWCARTWRGVIASARLLGEVPGVRSREIGEATVSYRPGQWGWSLAERVVLDRYRTRSA